MKFFHIELKSNGIQQTASIPLIMPSGVDSITFTFIPRAFSISSFEVSSSNTFSPSLITVSGTNRHSQPSVLSDKALITSLPVRRPVTVIALPKKCFPQG